LPQNEDLRTLWRNAPFNMVGLCNRPPVPLEANPVAVVHVVLRLSFATMPLTLKLLRVARPVTILNNLTVSRADDIASDCRGSVESSGRCADSGWSLWQGLNGNDFCCLVGMIGIYDYHNPVAGTCVSSAAAVGATSAAIVRFQSRNCFV
jgi:hypothetical protein